MRRGVALTLVLVAVVAAAGTGWWFGRRIESPAEAAARAEPPEPSLITVAVEQVALSADVIARGDIVFDDPVSVSLSGAIGQADATPIVTSIAEQGSELSEGDLMVEVAGRPVFLLQGEIPTFRDLRPGAEGIDVLQLETALGRLGYFEDPPDESWTSATGAAVQSFYDERGYRANAANDAELAALEAARGRVRSATTAVADAQAMVDASTGAARSEILSARAQVAAAEDAVELAKLDRTAAEAAAERAVEDASGDAEDASAALALAEERLAAAQAGTHPDTGLPPTAEELAELEGAVVAAAEAEDAAADTLASAETDAERVALEQASLVRQAEAAVDIAEAFLAEVSQPPDRTDLVRAVDAARAELTAAQEDLASLEAEVGTWVPAGEIVFLERVPVRVDRVSASLGDTVAGSFMTVSGSELTLRVQVPEGDVERLEVGDSVFVEDNDLEAPLEGEVFSIASQGSGGRVPVEVSLPAVPEELVGENVKVVIPIESTSGEVLAVPAAALSAVADGSVRVEVETDPGVTVFVTVEPGLAAGGLVEITPLDGDITEGDRVVVGQEFSADGD